MNGLSPGPGATEVVASHQAVLRLRHRPHPSIQHGVHGGQDGRRL